MKRFNSKNIDKNAEMACSNDCEGFYGVLAKFSEGKRLNLEHTDLWRSMIMLVFCRTGNIEETHEELSELLGLNITNIEVMKLMQKSKKRKRNREYYAAMLVKKHAIQRKSLTPFEWEKKTTKRSTRVKS
jgi:hypothetical protein